MGQIATLSQKVDHWKELFAGDRMLAAVQQACGPHLSPERVLRTALFAMVRTPQLLDCTPQSVVGAIVECSVLGLEVLGNQASMVPLKNHGTLEANLWIGYEGKMALAWRSGLVGAWKQESVHGEDVFPYDEHGDDAWKYHRKRPGPRTRETLTYAYARAWMLADTHHPAVVILTADEVEQAYKRAKSSKRAESSWNTDYPAMARKTASHQLSKVLPKDYAGARAAELEDQLDNAGGQQLGDLLNAYGGFVDAEFTSKPVDDQKPAARKKAPRKRPARKQAAKQVPQNGPGPAQFVALDVQDQGDQNPTPPGDTPPEQGTAGAPEHGSAPSTCDTKADPVPIPMAPPAGVRCLWGSRTGTPCDADATAFGPDQLPLCQEHLLAMPDDPDPNTGGSQAEGGLDDEF